ncbi:hypothetical protein BGZ94_005284 [Podila epigama]|nr:hypothetical protein BGZ94_005284 [Podila epigama]
MSFRHAIAFASILMALQVWMTSPVQAMGYAACIGIKVKQFKTVYGFHLWQTDGVHARHYVSSWLLNPRNTVQDKGWRISQYLILDESTYGSFKGFINPVRVEHNEFGINTMFNGLDALPVCRYSHEGRFRGTSVICQDDQESKGWCDANINKIFLWCYDYLDMGTDSLSCNETKRPEP